MRDALLEAQDPGNSFGVKIAVVGVGQYMRGDDAAGLEAVLLWQRRHPEEAGAADIRVGLVTVPGLELPDVLEGAEAAILVDAVRGSGVPGAIRALSLYQLEASAAASGSMHGWGVPEELRLGKALGQYSPDLALRLIGIEAAHVRVGSALSPAVHAALPLASDLIQTEIQALRHP